MSSSSTGRKTPLAPTETHWFGTPNQTRLSRSGENRKSTKSQREWAAKKSADNQERLERNPLYKDFLRRAADIENSSAMTLADSLIRKTVEKNPDAEPNEIEPIIQMSLDFLEFDAFQEIAARLVISGPRQHRPNRQAVSRMADSRSKRNGQSHEGTNNYHRETARTNQR